MAWDDSKDPDDLIRSSEWNTMVSDQKGRVVGTGVNEAIADTSGNLPAAGTSGRIFFETDTGRTLYDNGTSWVEVGLSESQISFSNINDTVHDNTQHSETYVTASEDVTNFDGSSGSSGQFLQTDGSNLSFASVSGGMTKAERQAFNDAVAAIARNQFANNLAELAYDGGFFEIWRDMSKIAGQSNVSVSTLSDGDQNGVVKLDGNTYNITAATFNQSFDVSTQASIPRGINFNDTGSKMYVVGSSAASVFEYSLSTNYDISTASFVQSFDVSGQDSNPRGIAFNDTGSKMFVGGNNTSEVNSYNLSTNYDISTASFNQNYSVTEDAPESLRFNNDGTKMFIVGSTNNNVYQYSLSTNYDISTASFVQSFDVSGQETDPQALTFNDNGSKMYVSGTDTDTVYEYDLSTDFDISTASLLQSKDISSETAIPTGIVFNNVGTKFFLAGASNDNVYEYDGMDIPQSGYVRSTEFDLTQKGLSGAPNFVVPSQAATLNGQGLQYVLEGGNGGTYTLAQSDIDTEVDISGSITSPQIQVKTELTSDGTDTPVSDDLMLHFKE